MTRPTLSIVVPLYNEAENLERLFAEIQAALDGYPAVWQVVFVDDGSRDASPVILETLHRAHPKQVLAIQFRTNQGKALALQTGFIHANGEVVITMDADLQDDPQEIKAMLDKLDEGYDLVSGWKYNRLDSLLKNSTSRLFNAVTRKVSGIQLHDFNCGFKAYRREAIADLNLYGELHRYIPVLVAANGFRVSEVKVNHRKRFAGTTKYGAIRFINGLLDLITVRFVTRYHSKPMHLFGYWGSSIFALGLAGGLYLTLLKLITGASIGQRPLLSLSILLMIIGVQLIMTGLVAELLVAGIPRERRVPPISRILS